MDFPVGSSAFLHPYTSSCPLIPAVYPRNTHSLLSTASNTFCIQQHPSIYPPPPPQLQKGWVREDGIKEGTAKGDGHGESQKRKMQEQNGTVGKEGLGGGVMSQIGP